MGPQSVGIFSILIDRKNKYDENCNIKPNAIISNLLEIEKVLEN